MQYLKDHKNSKCLYCLLFSLQENVTACESINFVECCLSVWPKFSFNKKYIVNLPHLALRTHHTLGNGNSNKIQVIRKDYSIGCKILG